MPRDGRTDACVAWLAAAHGGDRAPALELGVGTGRIALPLAQRTGLVVGVDSSPEMLDQLRTALARRPLPVSPVLADIRGYEDGQRYGLVTCLLGTLSIVLDVGGQQEILDTCARSIAPGGTVVIETHNPAAIMALHGGRSDIVLETAYGDGSERLVSRSIIGLPGGRWRLEHMWYDNAGERSARETTRLTSPEEIDAYAASAGLRLAARFAGWEDAPFTGAEPMVVSVYEVDPGPFREGLLAATG
jgi:SAM-dependent methyltransferase